MACSTCASGSVITEYITDWDLYCPNCVKLLVLENKSLQEKNEKLEDRLQIAKIQKVEHLKDENQIMQHCIQKQNEDLDVLTSNLNVANNRVKTTKKMLAKTTKALEAMQNKNLSLQYCLDTVTSFTKGLIFFYDRE